MAVVVSAVRAEVAAASEPTGVYAANLKPRIAGKAAESDVREAGRVLRTRKASTGRPGRGIWSSADAAPRASAWRRACTSAAIRVES